MKYILLVLLIILIPILADAADPLKISALPDGGATVDSASVMIGNIGSRTGTTSRFTIAELFGIKLGTMTDGKVCTYLASTGKINCTSSYATFDPAANYSPTGTWDFSGATVTGDIIGGSTKLTLADASTITPPAAATTVDGSLRITGTDGVEVWLSTTENCIVAGGASDIATCLSAAQIWAILQATVFPEVGGPTDEQLICADNTTGVYTLKACGAKVTDNSTASHAVYKDSSGYIADQELVIDAHAASTTITLIPGICPIIHNASQADSNINNTLPAVGAGKCFVALATSAEADKYWRLTAAAANTVCLNRTCGKDYIQFDTPAVGDTFTCMSDGTNWYCYDRDSDAAVGDL